MITLLQREIHRTGIPWHTAALNVLPVIIVLFVFLHPKASKLHQNFTKYCLEFYFGRTLGIKEDNNYLAVPINRPDGWNNARETRSGCPCKDATGFSLSSVHEFSKQSKILQYKKKNVP
jgi:hypothetical protein